MKASDMVNHKSILKKLCKLGIRGTLLWWIEHYLYNRKQCTIANYIVSSEKSISCGVPQGSVLGPVHFLVYVNDISGAISKCNSKVSLYADNTVLYFIPQ